MPRKSKNTAHAQRTDLDVPSPLVTDAPSKQYGDRVKRQEQREAIPLPANQTPTVATRTRDLTPPGTFGDFTRPTDRPDEPITAGLPIGPGPGPRARPGPFAITASNALRLVEEAVSGMESVSQATLDLLDELRAEARGETQ